MLGSITPIEPDTAAPDHALFGLGSDDASLTNGTEPRDKKKKKKKAKEKAKKKTEAGTTKKNNKKKKKKNKNKKQPGK